MKDRKTRHRLRRRDEIMQTRPSPRIGRIGRVAAPLVLACATLSGCAASRLMIRYGALSTQTEMSESVFLELRSDLPRTVYVSETSTAGREITIRPRLERRLTQAGYALVESPDEATYLIQLNHLSLTELELTGDYELTDALTSAFTAGATTAFVASEVLGLSDAAARLGVAVGLAGFVLDASTKHIAHMLTTDVLITESVPSDGTETKLRYHETSIASGASKVNLKVEESLPAVIDGLSSSLAGLMPPMAPN